LEYLSQDFNFNLGNSLRDPKKHNSKTIPLVSFIGDFFSLVQYNLLELEKKENFNRKNEKNKKNRTKQQSTITPKQYFLFQATSKNLF
jgi:hypothetical protein